MDYSLKSLRDAFEDAEYKQSRLGYDLYALLLATSLDQSFVLEYLSLFHELDVLTGDRVLVVGPQLGPLGKRDLIRSSELYSVREVIGHAAADRLSATSSSLLAAEQFLEFMQEQTRESYSIGRFLGIRTGSLPLLVFFDNLDAPHDRVEWPLEGKSGRGFVRDLRQLLKTVSEECGWDLRQHQDQLEKRAEVFCRNYFTSRDVPYELRTEWDASSRARAQFEQAERLSEFYDRLAALRLAYDRASADPELRIPLENVGTTITRLETGRVDGDSFSHLDKHYRRWKSRMPEDYKAALANISRPHEVAAHIRGAQLTLTPGEAKQETHRLQEQARKLADIYESKKRQLSAEAEAALADAKGKAARPKPPALTVIKRILSDAATAPFTPASNTTFRSFIRKQADRVPTVFISYSRESDSHAARVLEMAQRLRSDGLDCWIDQFEQGPAQGFPRWMVQQVSRADVVLIVCTSTYRRRFDGLDERGKGLGVTFEGHLILQEIYDASTRQRKFIPILLPPATREDIPAALRGTESFDIPMSYDRLVDRIFDVGGVQPQPLGQSMERRWTF